MTTIDASLDGLMRRAGKWRPEMEKLREIALGAHLTETVKWGWPCYTLGEANIVLIHGFKDYCAYLFFKGALMGDPKGILVQQTENVQADRQIRFTSLRQIEEMEPVLRDYIAEAIEIEKAGLKVQMKQEAEVPEELQRRLQADPALQRAFAALTPGRQRAYCYFVSQPKQAKTREARCDKYAPLIMKGKGPEDE